VPDTVALSAADTAQFDENKMRLMRFKRSAEASFMAPLHATAAKHHLIIIMFVHPGLYFMLRTVPQAQQLASITDIQLALNLSLRREVLVQKCCGRRICRHCGKNYNIAGKSCV
jgi:hypothetical protein